MEISNLKQTISSREIASLTGKRHSDVIRDIRNLLSKLNGNHNERMTALVEKSNDEGYNRSERTQYKYLRKDTIDYLFNHAFKDSGYCFTISEYMDSKGEKRPEYILTKKDSLLLISGYDVVLRSKIINRWEELEAKEQSKIPQSFSEALKLAYEQSLTIESQQKQLDYQKPLVTFAESLQISEHNILIGELAKILKQNGISIGQNRLFDYLREKGYLMKSGGQKNLPTQRALELCLFLIKTTTINNPDGSVRVTHTTKVTPKGQQYFINKLLK